MTNTWSDQVNTDQSIYKVNFLEVITIDNKQLHIRDGCFLYYCCYDMYILPLLVS